MINLYLSALLPSIWRGRDDSNEAPNALRLFQVIQQISFDQLTRIDKKEGQLAIIGFACDLGVSINKGRVGAAHAPDVIRSNMANFAIADPTSPYHYQQNLQQPHQIKTWFDLGNINAINSTEKDLDRAQLILARAVKEIQKLGVPTLVLGGGHETAFGHGLGLYQAHPNKKIGIINIDAHLDLRSNLVGNSGTPFLQLAEQQQQLDKPFHYLALGINPLSNTQALFANAEQHGVEILFDYQIDDKQLVIDTIKNFAAKVDYLYLSLDLDAIVASQMFAVSAPANYGLTISQVIFLIQTIAQTKQLISTDIVELNPSFDRDNLSARVAARLAWELAQSLVNKIQ